jgi:hypothetical protein
MVTCAGVDHSDSIARLDTNAITETVNSTYSRGMGVGNSGSLRRTGDDWARQVSEHIDQRKTADAAGIEMRVLFLYEVADLTCEGGDAQERDVTCHRNNVTLTHYAMFLEYLLHYLPPVK